MSVLRLEDGRIFCHHEQDRPKGKAKRKLVLSVKTERQNACSGAQCVQWLRGRCERKTSAVPLVAVLPSSVLIQLHSGGWKLKN